MSNTEGQIIKVRIASGSSTINEVFHDNTLKGTGQPGNELGIAESVLQDIASKVSDVQVNGASVVAEGVADITVGDATITIQKNGTDIDYFTANETTDKTINVEVPTTLRELSTVAEQAALDSGITSADVEQITTNKNNIATANGDITDINSKIPAQASAENKLADKNFVNSSIATNTANFIGTFDSVEELEAYSGIVTNNDYAFVVSEDSAGNTVYNRYKYTTATTPASWVFEYELNNSSFTADQWAAINSGATTTNIGQIATNTSTISGHIADKNNPHQVTKEQVGLGNVDNTSDTNKPVSTAQQTALNGKANTDLDNLTDTGQNIANWSSNVSNCITEIPQDIKLELNNGTLTLKAGSKAYKPDGTTYSATTDTNLNNVGVSGTDTWVIAMTSNNRIFPRALSNCVSGAGATTTSGYAYDTTTNIISWYSAGGVKQDDVCSFPIAIIHTTNGVPDEITQVFNGFGYIGSTIFALPGLKCLGADGRNADGTLKGYATTVSAVTTATPSTSNGTVEIVIKANSMQAPGGRIKTVKNMNGITSGSAAWYYSIDDNICGVYTPSTQTWSQTGSCLIGTVTMSSSKVASLNTKQAFHAVDYSDTEYMAHQAMPSDRYTNLTLPATGGTITAPADGYLTVNKSATAAGQYINFINGSNGMNCNTTAPSALPLRLCMPVSKGDVITINYDAAGTTTMFRFIYANGSK